MDVAQILSDGIHHALTAEQVARRRRTQPVTAENVSTIDDVILYDQDNDSLVVAEPGDLLFSVPEI